MANDSNLDALFRGMTVGDIRQKSRRMQEWLLDRLKDQALKKRTLARPRIGRMYLYGYDPKTKDELPYYDTYPLVIPVNFTKDGFFGINFHYLDYNSRRVLVKSLVDLQQAMDAKSNPKIKISYKRLVGLTNKYWKHCFKRYLFSHLMSRPLEIEFADWEKVLLLPIANFKKKSEHSVFADAKKYM